MLVSAHQHNEYTQEQLDLELQLADMSKLKHRLHCIYANKLEVEMKYVTKIK